MTPEQAAAREYIIGKCARLALGEEVTFDRRVVHIAFPAERGGRSRRQILDELATVGEGAFHCRRNVATGDFIVSRHELSDQPDTD